MSEYERQYGDGSDPRVLDIIDIPLLEPRPQGFQQENWLLDPDFYWDRVGRMEWLAATELADSVESLWIDGFSTLNGQNDRIPLARVNAVSSSLRLLRVSALTLSVFKPGEAFGNPKRRVQGQFRHAGVDYRIWVTDPVYERRYLAKPDGVHQLGESLLTVSLGVIGYRVSVETRG